MSEERISRSAGNAFLAQLVGAVITAGLTIYLARALTAEQYGSFTFAMNVVVLATLFADVGITSSTGRFMAERRGDPEAAADVFRIATRLKLRAALATSVLLFAFAEPICRVFNADAAVWPLRAFAVALLAQSMFMLPVAAFIALAKIKYNVLIATVESVGEALASIALVVLGAAATGAAFGNAIGYTAGALVGFAVAKRTIGSLRSPRLQQPLATTPQLVSSRRILSYAKPLLFVDAAFRVFTSIDVLLISALVGGGASVAAFGLPMRLTVLLDYPEAAVASAIAPRLAHWRSDERNLKLLARSLRYLLILQMLLAAPLVIWSGAIIHLIFGDKYHGAPAVLQALTPYVYLSGIAQITTLAVNYLGEARRRVPIVLAMLSVNVAIDVVFLPRIGIVAGAIGTSAAYAVWVPAHVWILHKRAGLQLGPLMVTILRTCVAGAAMVGVLAALGTGDVPLAVMVAGLFAGPAAYLAVLFAVRELAPSDVAALREIVTRRVTA